MKAIYKIIILLFIVMLILQMVGFSLPQRVAILFTSLFLRDFMDYISLCERLNNLKDINQKLQELIDLDQKDSNE